MNFVKFSIEQEGFQSQTCKNVKLLRMFVPYLTIQRQKEDMKYNFDELIERRGTNAIKYDAMKELWGREDLIPMWVADMDFRTPPFILEAIRRRLDHEVLGYTHPADSYYEAIIRWVDKRYGMKVERDDLHYIPGIVPGIHHAVCALTEKGDKIAIQPPVYHPFRQVIEGTGRVPVCAPLVLRDGRFCMDFDALRRALEGCKLFILCNPHNPGGVVWTQEELEEVSRICEACGVTVISDEIHADMVFAPHRHRPFATVTPWAREHTVTFMAPSKVFNMPGIIVSQAIVYNPELRERFYGYIDRNDLAMGNVFSYLAAEAAYTEGEEWLTQMLDYAQANIRLVDERLKECMPKIKAVLPEASFLIFLDCRELGFATQAKLESFFVNEARLGLNNGSMFGDEGTGFMRLNVAAPRTVVEQALQQLEDAYARL